MITPANLSTAFVTLFVTIGPIETAAVFTSLMPTAPSPTRRRVAARACLLAGLMLLLFAIAGQVVLELLHVSLPAFRVAGGMLLFLQALTLTFASPGLSSISAGERHEAQGASDIAVFPLAFPLIAGPGPLSAIVLLMGQSHSGLEAGAVIAVLILCLTLTYLALLISGPLGRWLGKTGADVVGRVSGVLLAALAVQFVFDGLQQAFFSH
jgi:multiple antibiotic resistance protein